MSAGLRCEKTTPHSSRGKRSSVIGAARGAEAGLLLRRVVILAHANAVDVETRELRRLGAQSQVIRAPRALGLASGL